MKTTPLTLLEVVIQENELTDRSSKPVATWLLIGYNKSVAASQVRHFVWLKLKPSEHGRWLSSEVHRFRPCANS